MELASRRPCVHVCVCVCVCVCERERERERGLYKVPFSLLSDEHNADLKAQNDVSASFYWQAYTLHRGLCYHVWTGSATHARIYRSVICVDLISNKDSEQLTGQIDLKKCVEYLQQFMLSV
jgi:hypothetical protein